MIYDLLANIGNYRGMNRNLDKAIDFLQPVVIIALGHIIRKTVQSFILEIDDLLSRFLDCLFFTLPEMSASDMAIS